MHNIFRIFAALALLGMAIVTPMASAATESNPVVIAASEAQAIPVLFESGFHDMTVAEIAAIVAGATVLGAVASLYFDSGLFTILGITVGAALGSYWYEGDLLPDFSQDDVEKLYKKYFD
jgi:hypothetical protein